MKAHKHFKQELPYSCSAATVKTALAILKIEKTEAEIRAKIKTNSKGTFSCNVFWYLREVLPDYEIHSVEKDIDWKRDLKWLNLISYSNLIFVSGDFVCGGNRKGRYSHRKHMFLIKSGICYDPAENQPNPIEAHFHTFDKELKIGRLILVHVGGYGIDIRA